MPSIEAVTGEPLEHVHARVGKSWGSPLQVAHLVLAKADGNDGKGMQIQAFLRRVFEIVI